MGSGESPARRSRKEGGAAAELARRPAMSNPMQKARNCKNPYTLAPNDFASRAEIFRSKFQLWPDAPVPIFYPFGPLTSRYALGHGCTVSVKIKCILTVCRLFRIREY